MSLLLCSTLLFLGAASGTLNLHTWSSTALGPQSTSNTSSIDQVDFASCAALGVGGAASSARITGTISDAVNETIAFQLTGDGTFYLWIEDHLIIDGGGGGGVRTLDPYVGVPFVVGAAQSFRLDYIHASGPCALSLSWSGNVTGAQVVPASAYAPAVTPAEAQRVLLKDRLLAPAVQWQTYNNPTMGCHVRMPQSFAVDATLAFTSGAHNGSVLGNIFVFRRSHPAITYVGPHSYNGSDYTQVTLNGWLGAACTVTLQTTVVNGGADLIFVASANGTDCGSVALLISPAMMWGRVGAFSAPSEGVLTAATPGFPNTTVFAAGAAPVPFAKGPAYSWALPLGGGAPVGYSTGTAYSMPAMLAAVAAAEARQAIALAKWGPELGPVYEPQATVIAWNTIYTPYEGVVTPVSRGWNFGSGYVLFDWDNLFLSFMASLEAESLDIAYSNLIQISLARTMEGFVPNFVSGIHVSSDRTEPQIGAFVALQIFKKWGDAWVIEVIFDALLTWNNWVWTQRRGEGSLITPDGHADLIVLGSNPYGPCSNGGCNNLQAARYESGLDNSPMYDGDDNSDVGPVRFDPNVTHHMSLYDVGMTGLYLSDTAALIELAAAINRSDVVPALQERLARVTAATNASLWSADDGLYANKLFNGSFYARIAPTSFFPLISGSATPEQAVSMMRIAASPEGFCMNTSYTPAPGATMIAQWWDGSHDNAACITPDCLQTITNAAYDYIRIEAVALAPSGSTGGDGVIPLGLWYSSSRDDYALTNSTTTPPDAAGNYAFIRQEGWCFATPPVGAFGWPTTNLSLWYSADRKDYQTCGSADCLYDTSLNKYTPLGNLCYAFNGTGATNMPCLFSGNSIIRSDPAFFDNNYWRGRIWGPHLQLIYWGLANELYKDIPEVKAARTALVAQSRALLLQEWGLFRQVTENYNGIIGIGEDVGNADPLYHWGALAGWLSFLEAGVY